MVEKTEVRKIVNHTDPNGNVCEYDNYEIDPSKYTPSKKTKEELKAEVDALRERILAAHNHK